MIVASVVPDPSEPNKLLAVAKVVFFSVVLIGGGMLLYAVGEKACQARLINGRMLAKIIMLYITSTQAHITNNAHGYSMDYNYYGKYFVSLYTFTNLVKYITIS